MTQDDLELRLRQNLREQAPEPSWNFRNRVMAEVADLPQRRSRIAGWWPEPFRLPDGMAAIIAGLLLTVLLIGAIALASGVVRLPSVLPPNVTPNPSATPDATPTTSPTTEPTASPQPVVVYQRHTRIASGEEGACSTPSAGGCTQWSTVFVGNNDGSEPRELTPGAWDAEPVALSPDGTQLIVRVMGFEVREDHYYLTDLRGSGLQLLDTGCVAPCIGDSGFAFSPDGERLAFIRSLGTFESPAQISHSKLAIMDWVTREVVELDKTLARDTAADHLTPEGFRIGQNESPRWSPDGAHLLFTRSGMRAPSDPNAFIGSTTFIVDDDGSNFREIGPLELFARDAHWSPDGARIVFTSAIEGSTEDRAFYQLNDIYTVRPDGTQLTRLTRYSEGPIQPYASIGALRPSWTRDGQIVFVLIPRGDAETPQAWIMDADGSNAHALLPADVSTFTRIGCVACPYPPDELADGGYNLAAAANAIWLAQP